MINVVIADDHRLVAEGLAQLIGRLPDTAVAGIACTLGDAVSLAGSCRPQILLLDVGMPDGDGIDAIPQLLEACPSCRIIMLTMYLGRIGPISLTMFFNTSRFPDQIEYAEEPVNVG